MNIPQEVLERILLHCDGKTLLTFRQIMPETIEYLSQKSRVWEWCCREEIPKNELIEYLRVYKGYCESYKWSKMYINWSWWQKNISKSISTVHVCPIEVQKISCFAVSAYHYAVGSYDGRLKIFTNNHKLIHSKRVYAVAITKIFIVEHDWYQTAHFAGSINMTLIVVWQNGFFVYCINDLYEGPAAEIRDVRDVSVFENYVCYEKIGSRVAVAAVTTTAVTCEFKDIWFDRIFSLPITAFSIWGERATFFVETSGIREINYKDKMRGEVASLKDSNRLTFSFPLLIEKRNCQFLRDDILINLYKEDKPSQKSAFMEILILDKPFQYSKKLYNTWDIFSCYITCICVYGNTFVLGTDIGNVYFFHVSDWKNLDLRNHDKKIVVGKHPITNIAVKETPMERKYCVTSRFRVYEITGYSPDLSFCPAINMNYL